MFNRLNYRLVSDPVCSLPADVTCQDFKYYDIDGFELNKAEQKYYLANGFTLSDCLNHICWQDDWFSLDHPNLILDHSLVLTRASFSGEALDQIKKFKSQTPYADYLIRTHQKWGFDFALDALDSNNEIIEVIHIEFDSKDYEKFFVHLVSFEKIIYNVDWMDAARRIEKSKDKWIHLKGFEQNHWKANFLIGWKQAEYTLKSI